VYETAAASPASVNQDVIVGGEIASAGNVLLNADQQADSHAADPAECQDNATTTTDDSEDASMQQQQQSTVDFSAPASVMDPLPADEV